VTLSGRGEVDFFYAVAADRAALAARYSGLAKRATWAIDVLE